MIQTFADSYMKYEQCDTGIYLSSIQVVKKVHIFNISMEEELERERFCINKHLYSYKPLQIPT